MKNEADDDEIAAWDEIALIYILIPQHSTLFLLLLILLLGFFLNTVTTLLNILRTFTAHGFLYVDKKWEI